MELLPGILVTLAGLAFGSFITLASYRLPRGQSTVLPASRCPSCSATLGIRDLVPVLSWLLAKRACRHCQNPVHWRYPAIELTTAACFLTLYVLYGPTPQAAALMLLSVSLLVLIVVDLEHYLIPDEVHYLLLPLGIAYRTLITETPLAAIITGAALGLATGLVLSVGYRLLKRKEGLGMGDVKFLAVAGLWLGARDFVPFLFFSGLFGVATALLWRALNKGPVFPFGPALACALFTCVALPAVPLAFWSLQGALYR